jgi:hypothetical protein
MPKGSFKTVEERATLSQESMIVLEAVEFVRKSYGLEKAGTGLLLLNTGWHGYVVCLLFCN